MAAGGGVSYISGRSRVFFFVYHPLDLFLRFFSPLPPRCTTAGSCPRSVEGAEQPAGAAAAAAGALGLRSTAELC